MYLTFFNNNVIMHAVLIEYSELPLDLFFEHSFYLQKNLYKFRRNVLGIEFFLDIITATYHEIL